MGTEKGVKPEEGNKEDPDRPTLQPTSDPSLCYLQRLRAQFIPTIIIE